MKKNAVLLLAEDDDGHAGLIMKNLKRAGVNNQTILFRNGEDILNFLFKQEKRPHKEDGASYTLLLDIRMPKVDGIEILRQVKQDDTLRKIPVIMVTTTDEPGTVKKCYDLGCTRYIVKPVDYDMFVKTVKQLGQFLMTMEVPG